MADGMRRILVVDDDPSIRDMVRMVLEVEGYEVSLADDGFAALFSIEEARPDCVVLDVMMPGIDGHDVLARIRAAERGLDLPVVMLTAAASDEQAWAAWSEGVDYFLAKPFDPDELLHFLGYLFDPERVAVSD